MRGLILGCITGMFLWATVLAQQVEFPLDYYSFEEIAQRMSVEGRRVDCARELRQRLAVIHLKPREWQQAREVLESGLDIRFRRTSESENRWILERNPDVMRQEKRWREQLAAYIERQRDRDAKLFRQLLDKNVSVDELIKTFMEEYLEEGIVPENVSREELEKQMRQAIETFRKMPVDLALRDWRAFQRMRQRFIQFLQKDTHNFDENDPFGFYRQFMTDNPISIFGFSQEVLDWARRAATDERDETLKSFREMMSSMGASTPDDPQLLQMLMLNMLGDFAQGYGQAWARDAIVGQMHPPLTALEAIEQGAVMREYVVTLTPEQLAWHLNDVEGKIVPLNSVTPVQAPVVGIARWYHHGFFASYEFPEAQPDEAFPFMSAGNIDDTISIRWERRGFKRTLERIAPELLRAYEKASETHAQFATQPSVNQPIKVSVSPRAPLVESVYRWAQEQGQEIVMEMFWRPNSNDQSNGSLAQRLEDSSTPSLLEQRNGVWIVRCWTAFVERVRDYPYAAIRNLLRSDYSYEAWRIFYRSVSPEQARWLMSVSDFVCWSPRPQPDTRPPSIHTGSLGVAWLILMILESLPPDMRERFWNPPADAPAPTLALAQLPLETRARLLQTLTLWRAALLTNSPLQGRERFLLPSAWLERLRLVRLTPYEWQFELMPQEPTDAEDADTQFLTSTLPGKLQSYTGESETELMLGEDEP